MANYNKLIKEAEKQGLDTLNLSHQGLNELPVKVCYLTHLEKLDLSNNSLTTLPIEIGKLENLKYLDLRNNNMGFLPEAVTLLMGLHTICLDEQLKKDYVTSKFKSVIYGYPEVTINKFRLV